MPSASSHEEPLAQRTLYQNPTFVIGPEGLLPQAKILQKLKQLKSAAGDGFDLIGRPEPSSLHSKRSFPFFQDPS